MEDEAQAFAGLSCAWIVTVRELMEPLNHPLLHLVGRLVGEGDGEDMLVALLFARQQQVDILLGQPVGFSAAGRGFHHFDGFFYLLHRRLKGQ